MTHPSDQDLLLYRQQAGGPRSAGIQEHLAGCPACRTRLQVEEQFDLGVSRRLPREEAPAALLARIRSGLGREVAAQEAGRSRLWQRLATGAVAASLVAGLGLLIMWNSSSHALPGLDTGQALSESANRPIRGQLVCVGCARAGADMGHQRACLGDGDLHVTGLRTPDGNLWRFMAGEPIHEYLEDRQLRGTWLEVSARPYPAIGYLQVAAVQRL
jgi:hypothetical protein